MERELWLELYRWLCAAATGLPRAKRRRFADAVVAAVYAWAVLHDRATAWAADARNWPADLLAAHFVLALPSQPTLSRRLRDPDLAPLLAAVHGRVAGPAAQDTLVKVVDSKPLPVGPYSRARDARWGRGARGLIKGYKLHAVYGRGPLPVAWEVVPANASEQRVAKRLFRKLKNAGYVLADSVYDVSVLYEVAAAHGHQLVARRKRPDAPVGARAAGPERLRSVDLLEATHGTGFGRELYRLRTSVERRFGRLTSFGGGLAPLPNWVRTLPRVRLWVQVKLLIDAIRSLKKRRLAA
jgi:Transposase DDE domain